MWSATVDGQNNVLRLTFADQVGAGEAEACVRQVTALLEQTRPGFCLVTDLMNVTEMDLACGPFIDQMMDLFSQRGIQKVVRLIPDPRKDIGFGIMSMFHYGRHVRVLTFKNAEEAKEHLPA